MESQFFGTLKADHVEGNWWRLQEPLGFYSAKYDLTICAPPGFVTDFASVPRLPLAYLFAGNTGHWEAVIHDTGYRFGTVPRSTADNIFYESGRVRSKTRENQSGLDRAGRLIRTSLMTGAVVMFGWVYHDPTPGCLDSRNKDKCGRNCALCMDYYPAWRSCQAAGYEPEILGLHDCRAKLKERP